ncbi:VOC family protein [Streptomyces cavernicola]|uniref:VOC family protein n=1 Tax=Streptomyces cavernicola TaxID=3043613 RepID=A0ABT6S9G6_9ACTN|nr:VOC family protein [Streptomyces sp. B-S-A6]MDI3404765.1 VOC family protein [Streptomyces sp. B-S-A6]
MNSHSAVSSEAPVSRSVFGAPCWVSLATGDLSAAEKFYSAVLGWEWRTGKLGEQYRFASVGGVPVAGVAAVEFMQPKAFAWTPYFATADADQTVARSQERGGTTAVGPLSFPPGRAALLADRDGAVFGIWEGELVADWEEWRRAAPVFVELHTRDAFDAAIFYAEVLGWASEIKGCCEVHYENEKVVLRSRGDTVAHIHSGAVDSARDPAMRPRWQIHFAVDDVQACVEAALAHGGSLVRLEPDLDQAILSDPDGARFLVNGRAHFVDQR